MPSSPICTLYPFSAVPSSCPGTRLLAAAAATRQQPFRSKHTRTDLVQFHKFIRDALRGQHLLEARACTECVWGARGSHTGPPAQRQRRTTHAHEFFDTTTTFSVAMRPRTASHSGDLAGSPTARVRPARVTAACRRRAAAAATRGAAAAAAAAAAATTAGPPRTAHRTAARAAMPAAGVRSISRRPTAVFPITCKKHGVYKL
jgi:hypothetical protein